MLVKSARIFHPWGLCCSVLFHFCFEASGSPTLYGLVAVNAVEFLLLLILAIFFVVVCKNLISGE